MSESHSVTLSAELFERLQRRADQLSQERQFVHTPDMAACEMLTRALNNLGSVGPNR